MKIKLDENLPSSLVVDLSALGHDVDTAPAEGLAGRPDPDVWRAAQTAERFLITQDLDFSDLRAFAPGTHYGILCTGSRRSRKGLRPPVAAFGSDALREVPCVHSP